MGSYDRLPFLRPGRPESQRYFLFVFFVFYLLNCFSPLRLEYDSVRYFALKDCLAGNCPAGFTAAGDRHPIGYPVLLWVLARIGLLNAWVVSAVNVLFLAGSLFLIKKSLPDSLVVPAFWPLVLLQWTFIKFAGYPLSEMQYLLLSSGCIYCFQRYSGDGRAAAGGVRRRRIGWLAAAFLLAALAFFTRTIGALLVLAMSVAMVLQHGRRLMVWLALAVMACIVCIVAFSRALRLDHYLHDLADRGSPVPLIREHLKEWGQLLLNVPGGKVLGWLPGWGNSVLVLAGLVFAVFFIYGLYLLRKKVAPVIQVYLIAYCLLLFNWPLFDARLWLPVVPFFVIALCSLKNLPRCKRVLAVVMTAYMLAGSGAEAFSLYTAFHKPTFARVQAGGIFRNEYETFFFGRPLSDTARRVDPYVLSILKRYN